PLPVIAVVDSPSADQLAELIDATGISGVQVQGRLGADATRMIQSTGILRWNVAAIGHQADLEDTLRRAREHADGVLVEAAVPGGAGGRGIVVDWGLAARARQHLADLPMILAGGLGPGNVAEAIALVGPDLVDVSSGVEISPGIKDRERTIRFLEAVSDAGSAATDRS